MPFWTPTPIWQGEDAYIIGGGPSLRGFDWDLLKPLNTIGCNSAYILGPEICKIVFFGDLFFFQKNREALEQFPGWVITNCIRLLRLNLSWLKIVPRRLRGMGATEVGWNGNSGAAAVNLALILGARRVFLLGFDMRLSREGQKNWHQESKEPARGDVYNKFIWGFRSVKADLPRLFPGREIINVTDGSAMNLFPKVGVAEHFRGTVPDGMREDHR